MEYKASHPVQTRYESRVLNWLGAIRRPPAAQDGSTFARLRNRGDPPGKGLGARVPLLNRMCKFKRFSLVRIDLDGNWANGFRRDLGF